MLKERKRQEQILERRAKKKDISEEEKNRVVWIDSTQMCVPIDDVIDSIIITSDKRYLKLIEIQPNNFGSLPIRKQNAVGDMFASMLSIVPARIQFKCFSRRGDITKLLERMKNDFSAETNENLVRMQEDYLNLVRQTATTIAVTRRFFAIIEYQHTNGMSGAFEDIASSLETIVSNSDTKVCLRVDEAEVSKLREVMELSEAEIEQIPKLPRGTGLLVTGSSRVQVQFRASPKEFEVLTTDPEVARREAAERARRLKALKEMQKQKEEEEGT